MLKYFLLLLIPILANFNGSCEQLIDSLIRISKEKKGNEQLHIILKVAEEFSYGNNGDTTIYYSKICFNKAKKQKDSLSTLKALHYWSCGLYSSKQYIKSIAKLKQVVQLSKQLNHDKFELAANYTLARNYQGLSDYKSAIQYFKKAYLLSAKNDQNKINNYGKACLRQLAYTYWYSSQLHDGISYFLNLIEKTPNACDDLKRAFYSNISFIYNRGVNMGKSEEFLLKAAEISNRNENLDDIYQDQAYLGDLYANKGEYNKSVLHYENAMEIAHKQKNHYKIFYLLQNLGNSYDAIGELKKGVDMIYEGIQFAIERNDQKSIAKAYQLLGKLMVKWQNFKDADSYLNKALQIQLKANFENELGNTYANLMISKYRQKERDSLAFYLKKMKKVAKSTSAKSMYNLNTAYLLLDFDDKIKESKPFLLNGLNLAKKSKSRSLTAYANHNLGKYYLKIDSNKIAKNYLLKTWNNHTAFKMLFDQAKTASLLSQVYQNLHSPDSAYFYLQKADSIKAKLYSRENVLSLYKKDNDLRLLSATKEKENLSKENKKLSTKIILIRLFYISISACVLIFILLYMKKRTQKLKSKIESKKMELEKFKMQTEIKQTHHISQVKEEIIDEINEKLLQNNKLNSQIEERNIDKEVLLKGKFTSEEDWDEFLMDFQKTDPHFITKLKNKYPKLTRNEIKIFILCRLELNTREMANVLMISPSSVNTARYRLRKKLQLDSSEKLEDVIHEICD